MLRLQNKNFDDKEGITICGSALYMDSNIWKNSKTFLGDKCCLIPVKNADGEVLAYAYQDNEANRELRMLRELRKSKDALQFTDIFPEYKEVVIFGCNELAVTFAEYLEELGVAVSVVGKYWEYFSDMNSNELTLLEAEEGRLIIYAEGVPGSNCDMIWKLKRSVSPEFECVDKIYEANVLKGRIHDTLGGFDALIDRLKEEREIIILGDDREAQDTYDLLMKYGIDICGFAVEEQRKEMLLGKTVMSIMDAMQSYRNPVFLNCKDTHSALGEEWTEYFDYREYERNKQYFLVRDYTDIPTSNLIHVLHGKKVLLTGDERLCQLLSDYLYRIENNEIIVQYVPLSEKASIEKDDILCLVIPDYHNKVRSVMEMRAELLKRQLSDMGFVYYTKYFISCRAFALVDKYLNCSMEKYTVSELTPKGILIGRIPAWSGNAFFRGIWDGHPEILMIPYSDFNENLFYYCVRLANLNSDDILSEFWKMYNDEAGSKELFIPYPEKFEAKAKRLLSLKESFTSQELFVLFHIAYSEMISGKQIVDISELVIYWEPHVVSRNEFAFFALWLEDKKINGQTIILRRNNIIRTGSCCARAVEKKTVLNAFKVMFLNETACDGVFLHYSHWTEYKMRFEDIKLKPREKLTEICERLGIGWSDSMMRTTSVGKIFAYRGSVDFDLKAVFNKYEDYLSEIDWFRISIASSCYQKKYGYSYENCLKFSRRELQELFLKSFLFEEKNVFEEDKEPIKEREWIRWQLWNVRKHMVLDDIYPEFGKVEVEQTGTKRLEIYNQEAINRSIEFAKSQDKLIMYGIGNDCLGLLNLLDEDMKLRLLYSDRKAEKQHYTFLGKTVIEPKELCKTYADYSILVTSSLYRKSIENEFNNMGIDPSRVCYNEAVFKDIVSSAKLEKAARDIKNGY